MVSKHFILNPKLLRLFRGLFAFEARRLKRAPGILHRKVAGTRIIRFGYGSFRLRERTRAFSRNPRHPHFSGTLLDEAETGKATNGDFQQELGRIIWKR